MKVKSINHKIKTIFLMTLFLSIHGQQNSRYHEQSYVGSSYLGEKTIRVYLPPSYSENNDNQYPVLYMMDGKWRSIRKEAKNGNKAADIR